jgi:hypothetical protein
MTDGVFILVGEKADKEEEEQHATSSNSLSCLYNTR